MMRQPTAYKPAESPAQAPAKEDDAPVPAEPEPNMGQSKPSIGQQVKEDFAQFDNNFDAVLQEINRGSIKSERAQSMMNIKGQKGRPQEIVDPLEQKMDFPDQQPSLR